MYLLYFLIFSIVVLPLKFSTVWNLTASLKRQVNPQRDWDRVHWRHKVLAGLPWVAAEVLEGYFSGQLVAPKKSGI